MFVYMLFNVRRTAQAESLYGEFIERYRGVVRDCRLRGESPRYLEIVFKADTVEPFISFAQEMLATHDFCKSDVEFAYDDGVFRFLFIGNQSATEDDVLAGTRRAN